MNKKQKKMLIRIIASAILLIILYALGEIGFMPATGAIRFIAYMIPYLIVGYDVLIGAFKGIKNGQMLDEKFLMAIATIGAVVLALYSGSGDYVEAIAVMLFYQIGEWFQSYAVGKSRKNISELMDIRPDYANIEIDGKIKRVDPDEVEIGSIIVVQPGEKVPLDGVVIEGTSTLNTAALTGESVPRDVAVGDEIISGCINENGVLRIKTSKEFGDSTVSKILDLVENATSRKSKSENFITKFARIYTPAVVAAAIALAIIPPLANIFILSSEAAWGVWIYRALTFLVASCPCALVVSIPLSFFAGIGGASNAGVLVKGSNYLETLSKTSVVVFDKTGTLTKGVFEVNGVHHNKINDTKLIEYAAYAESASSHPIARSILSAYGGEIDRSRISDIREISGNGVIAKVDGAEIAVGNDKLMSSIGARFDECHDIGTIIHIAIDGEYAGHIVISDTIKENSKEAISKLRAAGIKKIIMLTGDISKVADKVAGELGVDKVYSELLPGDKVDKLEEIIEAKSTKDAIAFVGDGINDAPVLRRADIGIAMGAMGSDAAIEAADVVLMDDDPLQIATAINISKKSLRIVYENIVFAIGVKLICLLLVAIGVAGMWLAVFADVGVMILAVLNAIRALFVKRA